MKKAIALFLVLVMCLGLCVSASAHNYSSVYDITDEDYLREDFHSVNDYGDLLGYTGKHFSQQSDTFPEGLTAILPESSYVPYKYPSTSITRLELPTSLVILDGSFETYTTGGYGNLKEVNFNELTNLKYIGGWFQSTPLESIDLRNTKVVRIAGEGTFSNNKSLSSFYAPNTLRRIDYGVFHDCPNLSTIELNEGLEYIGGNNFGSNTYVLPLHLSREFKRYITIPSTVTYIGEKGLPTHYQVWADHGATTLKTISARYIVYKGSYGEQWCKDNHVEYIYATDRYGSLIHRPYNPKDKLPENLQFDQFGDLLIAGDGIVYYNTMVYEDGHEEIYSYSAYLSPGSYIQTIEDGASFEYDYTRSTTYDSSTPDKLTEKKIRPYLTETYGNGYKKGLTWQILGDGGEFTAYGIYDIYVVKPNGERSVKYTIFLDNWASMNFSDVSELDYFGDPVRWAVAKGITDGTSDTTFSPNATCTNAQILTFLWRSLNCPEPIIDSPFVKNPFTGLTGNEYYYKAVLWAYQMGIISGDNFEANIPCTRSMTVTYLWKLAGSPDVSDAANFTDVDSSSDYATAVAWAVKKGITDGTSDTTFSPSATCTRGQIVTFLWRNFK